MEYNITNITNSYNILYYSMLKQCNYSGIMVFVISLISLTCSVVCKRVRDAALFFVWIVATFAPKTKAISLCQ